MEGFVRMDQDRVKGIVDINAELFSSQLCIAVEVPMMILTNTRKIFEDRRKRLQTMFTDNGLLSYSCTNIQQSSPSQTMLILDQNLSELSFTYLSSSSSQSRYASTPANIYSPPSAQLPKKDDVSQKQRSCLRQRLQLRQQVEEAVRHLVLQFHQAEVTPPFLTANKPQHKRRKIDPSVNNPESRSHISSEIESAVKAELKRYNICQLIYRNSIPLSTSLKVREKAQQLFKSLQTHHPV